MPETKDAGFTVRFATLADVGRLTLIQQAGGMDPPFTRAEWEAALGDPASGTLALVRKTLVVGYCWYDVNFAKQTVILRHVVVHPDFQKKGGGATLLQFVKNQAMPHQETGNSIRGLVPENNLPAQLLLKKAGFRCCKVKRNAFTVQGSGEPLDGYLFVLGGKVVPVKA